MARPRTASDAEIVARVSGYLAQREWPAASWALAEVAPAAGLSPAGLVKRFGSREGLLLALGRHWVDGIPSAPTTAEPLTELRGFARDMFLVPTAAAAVGGIGDLVADLASSTAAATLAEGRAKQHGYVAALLRKLAYPRAGEPELAARILLDALHGVLLSQAADAAGVALSPDDTIDYFLELWI